MIFSSNTTALSATTIPMAEGYDCSCGVGLALVESARNDLSMFQALVSADYKEMSICRESTGVVQEGELAALHEAVGGGIFKKIAELFRKLVAKIKGIFHNFMARLRGLYMKDKELVKKYQVELGRKANLDKLEVKWRKYTDADLADAEEFDKLSKGFVFNADDYKSDNTDRLKVYFSDMGYKDVDSVGEFTKELIDDILDDEDTLTLGEIGGWRKVAGFISDYDSRAKKMEKAMNSATKELEKLVDKYDKEAMEAAKVSAPADATEEQKSKSDTANKTYEMAQAYQTVTLAAMQAHIQVLTIVYKQNKAAFVKAVTASSKKLEESALDAIAEAAEDEVENVITGALSKEELSDLCAASTNVKDADVKDDPDALTYGPDCYSDNADMSTGKVAKDVDYVGTEESAYFGKLFY